MDTERAERHKANVKSITDTIRDLAGDDTDLVPELASILDAWVRKLLHDSLPPDQRDLPIETVEAELLDAYSGYLERKVAHARAARAATGVATAAKTTPTKPRRTKRRVQ